MRFKKGERVRVNFEKGDGTISVFKGKVDEIIDLGVIGEKYCLVRLSKFGSLLAPLKSLERVGI